MVYNILNLETNNENVNDEMVMLFENKLDEYVEKITINSRTIKSAKIKIVISFEIVTPLLNTLLNSMLTSSSNGKNNSFNSSSII